MYVHSVAVSLVLAVAPPPHPVPVPVPVQIHPPPIANNIPNSINTPLFNRKWQFTIIDCCLQKFVLFYNIILLKTELASEACLFSFMIIGNGCRTTAGHPCVFPFFDVYGVMHHGCTSKDWTQPWCATAVNPNRMYTKWGACANCNNQPQPMYGIHGRLTQPYSLYSWYLIQLIQFDSVYY